MINIIRIWLIFYFIVIGYIFFLFEFFVFFVVRGLFYLG